MAALQEFIEEKYVESYEEVDDNEIKVEEVRKKYPTYFYDPSANGIGSAKYVVDGRGHALYLIRKEELPSEIREGLIGGDAGRKEYQDYLSLRDVYGVTFDLKVYYCSGDGIFRGINASELNYDNLDRVFLNRDSELAQLLSEREDGTITGNEALSMKNVTLNKNVSSLKDLYAFPNLEYLTLENMTLTDLTGLEYSNNLREITFRDTTVEDYTKLGKVGRTLEALSFYRIDDIELEKICNGIKDSSYQKLKSLLIRGNENYYSKSNTHRDEKLDEDLAKGVKTKFITSLAPLGSLSSDVVGNITNLDLYHNRIGNRLVGDNKKHALEYLSKFIKLNTLMLEGNNLTDLKGISILTNLVTLYANNNELGLYETYNENGNNEEEKGKNPSEDSLSYLISNTKLKTLELKQNYNLKWVGYLSNLNSLTTLHFGSNENDGCMNMIDSEVGKLRDIFKQCGSKKSYPNKYWLALLDTEDRDLEISLADLTVTEDQFKVLGNYVNAKILNLKNVKIENEGILVESETEINELVNDTLKTMKNLKYVNFYSSSGTSLVNLSEIRFLKGVDETKNEDDIDLLELETLGTKISTRKTKEEKYENGLMLLGSKKVGSDEYYCPDLQSLLISGQNTQLSDISVRIKKLLELEKANYSFFDDISIGNFYTDVPEVMESLSGITDLEKFIIWGSANFDGVYIDLSQTQLKEINIDTNRGFEVILPSTCQNIRFCPTSGTSCDFSYLSSINKLDIARGENNDFTLDSLCTIPINCIIDTFRVSCGQIGNASKDLSFFKNFNDRAGRSLIIKNLVDTAEWYSFERYFVIRIGIYIWSYVFINDL